MLSACSKTFEYTKSYLALHHRGLICNAYNTIAKTRLTTAPTIKQTPIFILRPSLFLISSTPFCVGVFVGTEEVVVVSVKGLLVTVRMFVSYKDQEDALIEFIPVDVSIAVDVSVSVDISIPVDDSVVLSLILEVVDVELELETVVDNAVIIILATVPVYLGPVVSPMLIVVEADVFMRGFNEFVVVILGAGCVVKSRDADVVVSLLTLVILERLEVSATGVVLDSAAVLSSEMDDEYDHEESAEDDAEVAMSIFVVDVTMLLVRTSVVVTSLSWPRRSNGRY